MVDEFFFFLKRKAENHCTSIHLQKLGKEHPVEQKKKMWREENNKDKII